MFPRTFYVGLSAALALTTCLAGAAAAQDAPAASEAPLPEATAGPPPDIAEVIVLLENLRAEVNELRIRVDALEAGTGTGGAFEDATAVASVPAAPRAADPVQTVFPRWMRDGRPPDQIDDLNLDVVRWRDRADDEAGYAVYARRGYCQLRSGADPDQALEEDDFRLRRTAAVPVEQLPADTTRYRPDHEAIEAALPEAPASPYSNDQFYDLAVAAFNEAGESERVLVGSFFVTPEFRCP